MVSWVLKMRNALSLAIVLLLSSFAQAQGMKGKVNSQALAYFPYWVDGASPQTHDNTMRELISLDAPSRNWPPFPRTWLELGLERTETTTTGWAANVSGWQKTIPIIGSNLNVGAKAEFNTQYRYNVTTTFIAISSLRPVQPEATQNSDSSLGTLPSANPPIDSLRSIVDWDDSERRAYFNVNKQFPIMGLCKFEMSLRLATTEKNTIEFLINQRSNEKETTQTTTLAIYSNFFEVRNDVPVQEYLRTTCDSQYKDLVRYLADSTFNNVIKDVYANYHPKSQCTLRKANEPLDPRGDMSCRDWFLNPRFVMGSYRRDNVPRCELGNQGIPICVLRAKENGSCPVYYADGKISERAPVDGSGKMVTVGNYNHYSCDKGLSCKPRSGRTWAEERLGWYTPYTGVEAYCQK